MKKLIPIVTLLLALVMILASCDAAFGGLFSDTEHPGHHDEDKRPGDPSDGKDDDKDGDKDDRTGGDKEHVHTNSEIVRENIVEPTCTEAGSYDEVVYCTECEDEISRTEKTLQSIVSALDQSHCFAGDFCKWCNAPIPESSEGLEFSLNEDGESYTLVNASNCKADHLIISTYQGKPVTAIAEGALATKLGFGYTPNYRMYKSISLGDGVKNIADGAFQLTYTLQFNIGAGLEYYPEDAVFSQVAILKFNVNPNNEAYKIIDNLLCTKDGKTLVKYAISPTDCFRFYDWEYLMKEVDYVDDLFILLAENHEELIKQTYVPLGFNTENSGDFEKWYGEFVTPEYIESIGSGAFCLFSPQKVIITDNVRKLNGSFSLSFVEEVVIGDGITEIGVGEFSMAQKLRTITIGKNVTSIGNNSFSICFDLIEIINHSTVNLLTEDFSNYDFVTECWPVVIHNGTESLIRKTEDGYLFITFDGINYLCGYVGKETDIVLPDNYNGENYVIKDFAFAYESSIASVIIPDSVTSIGEGAFADCEILTSVTIGNGVKRIGESAFEGCTSLTNIVISDSVTSIGARAFYDTGYYNDESNWENDVLYIGNCLIAAENTISDEYVIKAGTRVIADEALAYCHNIMSVKIPDGVISIGNRAFYNCSGLTSATIPASVTSIGSGLFSGCDSLTSITVNENNEAYKSDDSGNLYTKDGSTLVQYAIGKSDTSFGIPDGVTSISDYAFYGCSSLTSITIPDSITSIGAWAFCNCYNLTSVTIPNGVTSIGDGAFGYCSSLASVTFGENSQLKIIYDGAFRHCNSLTSITIPDSVTSVGSKAFEECGGLTSVKFGKDSQLKFIGYQAFYDCDSLTSITIPANVTSIGDRAFAYCKTLTSITVDENNEAYKSDDLGNLYTKDGTILIQYSVGNSATNFVIPEGVTSISEEALYGCHSLANITIPYGVKNIGRYAFGGCRGLTSIVIPDSVTSIGYGVFSNCTSLIDVYYTGSEEEWASITIDMYNDPLTNATIHYNYTPEE